jgi:glutamine synthetase
MSNPKSAIKMAREEGAKMVDVKFVDTFGTWQHSSCPIAELTEEACELSLRPSLTNSTCIMMSNFPLIEGSGFSTRENVMECLILKGFLVVNKS